MKKPVKLKTFSRSGGVKTSAKRTDFEKFGAYSSMTSNTVFFQASFFSSFHPPCSEYGEYCTKSVMTILLVSFGARLSSKTEGMVISIYGLFE